MQAPVDAAGPAGAAQRAAGNTECDDARQGLATFLEAREQLNLLCSIPVQPGLPDDALREAREQWS